MNEEILTIEDSRSAGESDHGSCHLGSMVRQLRNMSRELPLLHIADSLHNHDCNAYLHCVNVCVDLCQRYQQLRMDRAGRHVCELLRDCLVPLLHGSILHAQGGHTPRLQQPVLGDAHHCLFLRPLHVHPWMPMLHWLRFPLCTHRGRSW